MMDFRHRLEPCEFRQSVLYLDRRFRECFSNVKCVLEPHQRFFGDGVSQRLERLEEFKNSTEEPLNILVRGDQDVDRRDLLDKTVQHIKLQSEDKSVKGPVWRDPIVVCNVVVKRPGDIGQKDCIRAVISALSDKTVAYNISEFLVFGRNPNRLRGLDKQFRNTVILGVEKTCNIKLDHDNFIIDGDESALGSRISTLLEKRTIEHFVLLRNVCESFGRPIWTPEKEKKEVLEQDTFMKGILSFLTNGLGYIDLLENAGDSPFMELVLNKLCIIVRCSLVEVLASTYGKTQDMCNFIAHEVSFEEDVKKAISKNTHYRLSKLEEPCKEFVSAVKSGDKSAFFAGHNHAYIAYHIKEDIKPVADNLRDIVKDLCKVSTKLCRQIFVIDGYLSLFVNDMEQLVPTTKPPVIPPEFRDHIVKMKVVFGIGTIFGKVEIHVREMVGADDVDNIQQAAKKYKFVNKYVIKHVSKEPEELVIRHGKKIKISDPPPPTEPPDGTLGCYAKDITNDKLYAITAAHVVRMNDQVTRAVLYNPGHEQIVFARSHSTDIYPPQARTSECIDIAAVEVLENVEEPIDTLLLDEDRSSQAAELALEESLGLKDTFVYKHGAGSELTKGQIASVDYSSGGISEPFSILITSVDDNMSPVPYAVAGDSGSVNCQYNFNSVKPIKVVSVNYKGDMRIQDEEDIYTLSFRLNEGLHMLNEHTNKQFHFHCE